MVAGRLALALAAALLPLPCRGHVPVYASTSSSCKNSCCKPIHPPTWSQAFYFKGSGGYEVDLADLDVAGNELIDYDLVFKEKYSTSSYTVHLGCGGCGDSSAPQPLEKSYKEGHLVRSWKKWRLAVGGRYGNLSPLERAQVWPC